MLLKMANSKRGKGGVKTERAIPLALELSHEETLQHWEGATNTLFYLNAAIHRRYSNEDIIRWRDTGLNGLGKLTKIRSVKRWLYL